MTATLNLTPFWSGARDQFSDRGGPERILHLSNHLPWLLDAGNSFMDLGCGCGGVVRHIQSTGRVCIGVTYQEAEVAEAAKRGVSGVVFGDIHDPASFPPPASLDGALLWDVIEHTLAPLVVLKNIHEALRPGGRLLIFVPGQRWGHSWYHTLVPTQAQMRHLLELSGFTSTTCVDYSREDAEQAVYKVEK